MTNKPMLSVERELLESLAAYVADSPNAVMRARSVQLRALLDAAAKPAESFEEWAERELGLPIHRIASGDYQSFGMACAERAWNAKPAAKHQGIVTLEQVLKAYDYANSHPHKYLRGTTNWCAAVAHALNAEQPAPVAPITDDELIKLASEAYGKVVDYDLSGKPITDYRVLSIGAYGPAIRRLVDLARQHPMPAPVALVMPDRREPSPSNPYLSDADHEYNSALDDVARLSGVKP